MSEIIRIIMVPSDYRVKGFVGKTYSAHFFPSSLFFFLSSQPLTVTQIKKVQSLISEASERTKVEIREIEEERHKHLTMIGNILHPSVPISNDEVGTI